MKSSMLRVLLSIVFVTVAIVFFLAMYTCFGATCFAGVSTTPVALTDYDAFLKGHLLKHEFSQQDLNKQRKIDLEEDDVLVYLHMQKTGGATFGRHLVHNLDVKPPCQCVPGIKKCTCLTSNKRVWLFSRHSTGWVCGLHADWTELQDCMDKWFQENDVPSRRHRRYHFISFLRNPVLRFISEWQHVQRGATWSAARLHCNGRSATLEEVPFCFSGSDWSGVSFEEFFSCKHNLAFNRMTRMLANLTEVNCYNRTGLDEDYIRETMLSSAKRNLRALAFFGIVEEQKKTQFLFERTFGLRFINNFKQKSNTHVSRINITDEMWGNVTLANDLDVCLYQYAKDLFYQRVETLEKQLGYTVAEYFDKIRDKEKEEEGEEIFEDETLEDVEGETNFPQRVSNRGSSHTLSLDKSVPDFKLQNKLSRSKLFISDG